MVTVKKLLCPTDFSDPSFKALQVAGLLGNHFSAEVLVVHVITPMPTFAAPGFAAGEGMEHQFGAASYLKEIEVVAQESLDKTLKERIADTVNARSMIMHGDAADSIVKLAAEESVDAIIIATHGYTGFRRFIHGSVTEKVVRLAQVPVLTIPAGEE